MSEISPKKVCIYSYINILPSISLKDGCEIATKITSKGQKNDSENGLQTGESGFFEQMWGF